MKQLLVNGNNQSKILIGASINEVDSFLPKDNVFIITDDNLFHHYSQQMPLFPIIKIGTSEAVKNLQTIEHIIDQLIDLGADRHSFILGIGGGVVCDIAGFVASIYMRGLDFGFISTSLLSQVDASVGGKNGVNFRSFKNIIGNFNQPRFVICDQRMLKTLSERELRSGLAEIVKVAVIYDKTLFNFISNNVKQILNLDLNIIEELVYRSVKIKAEVVEKDELEQGERKKLNFGHTLGHAIENQSNLLHGEAVSVGMVFAAKLSFQNGFIKEETFIAIESLLKELDLPVSCQVEPQKMAEAISKDKKKNKDRIDFVFIKRLGEAMIQSISIDDLKEKILTYDYK